MLCYVCHTQLFCRPFLPAVLLRKLTMIHVDGANLKCQNTT